MPPASIVFTVDDDAVTALIVRCLQLGNASDHGAPAPGIPAETLRLPVAGWHPSRLGRDGRWQAEALVAAAVAGGAITAVAGYSVRLAASVDARGKTVGQWLVTLPGLDGVYAASALFPFEEPPWITVRGTAAIAATLIRQAADEGNRLVTGLHRWAGTWPPESRPS
jgi:hypothetical protein